MEEEKVVYRTIQLASNEYVLRDFIAFPGDRIRLQYDVKVPMRIRIFGADLSIEFDEFRNRASLKDEVNIQSE